MNIFELEAESRSDMGKGASRRLRRDGKVPAIMYGAEVDPQSITLVHSEIIKRLAHEGFYSHILTVNVDGKSTKAVLRDMQRHPAKPIIMHMDFQRVEAKKEMHVNIPLHFINEDIAPGVKTEGGAISHVMSEVEIVCLPKNIPEFIDVDLSELHMGEIVHLSDLKMPAGVEVLALKQGEEYDSAVATIHARKVAEEIEEEEEAAGEAAAEPETREEGGESEG